MEEARRNVPAAPDPADWAGRRVLVTGARGFLGGRLAARLLHLGAEVRGLDREPGAPLPKHRFFLRDLLDPAADARAAVARAVTGTGVVFHLAAANGHRESMERPRADFRDNVLGTIALLAAVAAHAPRARLVFASTRQLYGPADHLPATEDHRVAPPDAHSVHKETAEHLIRHHARERGAPFAILRLTNTYGPGQPTAGPSAGLAGRFVGDAVAGRGITVLGDPETLRDFNHVDDVVDAFLRAGRREAPSGTWNLGARPVSIGAFAAAIFHALGEPPRVRSAPLPPEHASIAIGDFHSDASRSRRELGWEPRRDLESGLAGTVRALREAPR